MDNNIYTTDDYEKDVEIPTGEYKILRSTIALATGEEPQGKLSYNDAVDDAWSKTAPQEQYADYQLAQQAAAQGDVPLFERVTEAMRTRNEMATARRSRSYEEAYSKGQDLARAAMEVVAASEENILVNNTPVKLAEQTDALARVAGAGAALEKEFEDALKLTKMDYVTGILHELTPVGPLQGWRIQNILVGDKQFGITKKDVDMFTTRNELVNMLQQTLRNLPPEERLPWLSNLNNAVTDTVFTNKLYTSAFITMIAGEDAVDVLGFTDWADRVGVATLPLIALTAWARIGTRISKATSLDRQARIVAQAGGKGVLESADAAKLANQLKTQANLERAKAGLLGASEASGVQGVLDLAKLASVSVSRVLPEALTSPATALTSQVRTQVDGLVDNLKNILLPKSVTTVNVAQELQDLQRVFSRANNPLVSNAAFRVADDGLSISGVVTYKPKNASVFLTRADADLFNKTQLGGKGRVVEDTTNTGFLVDDDVVKALTIERDSLLAETAEQFATVKAPKRARKATTEGGAPLPTTVVPAALKTAKPRYKTNELSFDDDIDKAAYQVGSKSATSKSDAEIKTWLQSVTGWDDKQIATHAAKVREALKRLPEVGESVRVASVQKDVVRASTTGKVGDVSRTSIDVDTARAVFSDEGNFTRTGNVVVSKNVPNGYVTPFIQKLGRMLGMEKHPVAVLQLGDIVSIPKYRGIADLWASAGPGTNAMHIPTSYGSIIVMGKSVEKIRKGVGTNVASYMDLLAHEYGHAFEYVFTTSYGGMFGQLYRNWLNAKGIKYNLVGAKAHISETLPLEALLEYRSIGFADVAIHEKGLEDWVSKYLAGNTDAYKRIEGDMRDWLNSHSEFFAENFSKWALTSDVATNGLGEMFTKLVEGIRTIAVELQTYLKNAGLDVPLRTDAGVDAFMNKHVKLVEQGKVKARAMTDQNVQASKGIKSTTKDKLARISQIEAELEAINAAKTGAVRGFVVESDVKKFLTFASAGKYADEDISSAVRFAFGDFTLEASSEAVNKRLVGVHANSAYKRNLTEFVRKDVEKLNKQEKQDLNAALVRGDQEGIVFKENELAGMGLTSNARTAYFKVRALRDVMYQVKNDSVAKVLTRKGFLDMQLNPVRMPEGMTGRLFGRSVELEPNQLVYNLTEGKLTRVGESSKELVAYELAQPIQINGKYYTKVVAKPDDLTPSQITEAIPYRAGEYSRHYEDEYWIKIDTTFDVDGQVRTGQQVTHRTAASKKDADAYTTAFNDMVKLYRTGQLNTQSASKMAVFGWKPDEFVDAMQSGKFGADPKANTYFTRTDEDFISNDTGLGGVMGGTRGERIENVYGNANTLNPLDSIASEISNTAYVATTLEWREAQVAKWWNTFFDDLPPRMQAMKPDEALLDVINNKTFYAGDKHSMSVAYNTAKYIESQLNILTSEEQFYLGAARVMSEKLEGTNLPAMHSVGKFMRESSNWPQFVRTIAFHSYMGAFNIKHLFMQSMNAFNAVAISPVYGVQASKVGALYGIALMSDNPSVWRQVANTNKLTSLGLGMSTDEFVETVRAIRRTGLVDGIQFNSMWGAEGGKYGLFNGFTRKLGKVSATPFNIGDGYSRIVSFDIARREYKAANPGAAWWADDALESILARQDDLTQNMTMANRAGWQRGAASIPFQFTQYQIKIALNIMQSLKGNTRTFTRAEAIQLFVGHTAFLGLAGWGILPDEWLDNMTEGLPESERLSIQQGIFSWGIYHLTGGEAKLAVGSTFGTFNYYKEILDGLVDPEKTLVEALAGAGGAAAFNWMGKAGNVIGILHDRDISIDSTKDMLTELGTGFSSVNNAYKAYIAANSYNVVKSKAGKNQYIATDLELFGLSLGVPPTKQFELDKLITNDVKRRKELKSLAGEIGQQMVLAAVAQNNNDTKAFEYRMNVVKTILEAHRSNMDDYNFLVKEMYRSEYGTRLQDLLIENMRKDLPPPSMMLEKPFKE